MRNSKKKENRLISFYRYNWYKLTFVTFTLLSYYMGFWGHKMLSSIQIILVYSFMSVLAHQFEEYVLPGGGPVVINKANFDEKENYRRYPGNMNSAMYVNHLAYLFYIAAIIWPNLIWLGLGTMFFNLFQLIGHGLKMNHGMKTWYNPGLGTVIILFVPISIYYMSYITNNQLVSGWDWFGGVVTFILATLFTTILPVQILKDANTPYEVPEHQVECCDKVQVFTSIKSLKE